MVQISTHIELSRARSVDRLFDFIFFVVENAATRRYVVTKEVKYLPTYLRFRGTFFGVIQKESINMPWNFDWRFVSEETWIKSSTLNLTSCVCYVQQKLQAENSPFDSVCWGGKELFFFSNPLDVQQMFIYVYFIIWLWCSFSNLLETLTACRWKRL
jgi:hypothetical protein